MSTNVEAMHQGDQKGLLKLVMLGQKLKLRNKGKGKFTLGQVIEACITEQNKKHSSAIILYFCISFLFVFFFFFYTCALYFFFSFFHEDSKQRQLNT